MANEMWQGSTGSAGANWNVGSNWNTGVVPQAGDTVTIPSGTPSSPNLSGSTVTIGSLTVANGASVDLTGNLTVTGDLTDNGSVGLDYQQLVEFGGSTLTVDGTLTTTNGGAPFTVGNRFQTAPTTVVVGTLANTGGIDIAGNAGSNTQPPVLAQIDVASAAGFGGMAGVLTGNIALGIGIAGGGGAGDALLDFQGGGLIDTIDGSVSLFGPDAFIASGNATSSDSALSGPLTIANGGGLSLQGGASLTTGSLTANGGVGIDAPIESAGGSTLTVSGTLTATNGGAAFSLGNEDQTAPTTVTASAVTNTGGIEIGGNPGGTSQAPVLAQLDVASAAGFGGMPGVLTGNVTLGMGIGGGGGPGDALLDFQGGGLINTIESGNLALSGALSFVASGNATSSNSALTGPLTIASGGGLSLQTAVLVTTQSLTDAGSVSVDTGFLSAGGSILTVNGVLTVSGELSIGRSAMTTAGATAAVTGLSNSGTINLDGDEQGGFQGVLDVGTAAGLGTAGVLSGNVNLSGFSLLDFAGGGLINTIDGSVSFFGPNDFIASGNAMSSNSALTGPLTIASGGGLDLQTGVLITTQSLTDAGSVSVDTGFLSAGGSILTVNGVLTVSGELSIGRSAMTTAGATVVAGSLSNSGTINLDGDEQGGFQGNLDISATAGFGTAGVLSGTVNLTGFSLLDFTGGLITSIDNTGNLLIDGPDAFLASGTATSSNSALTGLASMDGVFTLADGAALATNTSLSIGNGTNGSDLNVESGAGLTVADTLSLAGSGALSISTASASAAALSNAGEISLSGNQSGQGTLTVSGSAANTGTVTVGTLAVLNDGANAYDQAAGSTVVSGTLSAGAVDITGGTLELAVGGVVNGGIRFAAVSGGELKIDGTTMPGNTISGFTTSGDAIDLTGLAFSGNNSVGFNSATNMLTVTEGGASATLQLDAENYTGITWSATQDAGSGTEITATTTTPCYCRGTLILTERGEVPVEALAVGDRLKTLSGAFKPIVWIGMGRDLVTRRNRLARPVIVRRGALADEVPRRDLYLTHGHALYWDGVLIPVEHLVNHRSILWDDAARVVEYYHIELAQHDVVFAEGAPAETYHDAGNRAAFQNVREGSAAAAAKPTFAPVLQEGEIVETAWEALFTRASGRFVTDTTDDPDLHLRVDGERLDPETADDGVYRFALEHPPSATLLLCSRSAVPSLIGLGRSDHRPLGVPIGRIVLWHAGIATSFEHDAPQLREGGCHPAEDGYSWTDGEFQLPARFFTLLNDAFTLAVHTRRHCMRYPIAPVLAEAA